MEHPDQSPLDALLIDREPLDLALLASTLLPFVRLHSATGEIIFTESWEKLPNKLKVAVYLLARKAAAIKKLIDDDKVTPSQAEKETGLAGGSLRPQLSALVKEKLASTDKEGNYWIADYQISRINKLLAAIEGE